MYGKLLFSWFGDVRHRASRWTVNHFGAVIGVVVTVVILGVAVGIRERGRGHFHRLKTELKVPEQPTRPLDPMPGGLDPIVLQRTQIAGGSVPEFLSATLLPGRGMQVLQILAFVPGRGEVQLLASPTLEEATRLMTGKGDDADGQMSLLMGAPVEFPWASRLSGTRSPDGLQILTEWRGRGLSLPAFPKSSRNPNSTEGGLLLTRRSASAVSNVMPDGGEAVGTFTVAGGEHDWPSQTEVTTTVLLSSRTFELKVVARNTGGEPEPVGIGWVPRFLVPSGRRDQAFLKMPASQRLETRGAAVGSPPTGKLITAEEFTGREGAKIGHAGMEAEFVHLRPALLDIGPAAELRDPASNSGLRITMLTPVIRSVRVEVPSGERYVTISPQMNYTDPFGREWPRDEDTGMVVLEPGKSVQWKIRLEIFPLTTAEGGGF